MGRGAVLWGVRLDPQLGFHDLLELKRRTHRGREDAVSRDGGKAQKIRVGRGLGMPDANSAGAARGRKVVK